MNFTIRSIILQYFRDPVNCKERGMQQARIVLASKGLPSSTPDVRAYQRDILGRKDSESRLLELLPLLPQRHK